MIIVVSPGNGYCTASSIKEAIELAPEDAYILIDTIYTRTFITHPWPKETCRHCKDILVVIPDPLWDSSYHVCAVCAGVVRRIGG